MSAAPELLATGLILTSAFLHAFWNALLKKSPDKFAAMTFISGYGGLFFLPFVPFVAFPSAELWGWIALSLCVHLCYQVLLAKALEIGDLTFSYPIARGTGPMLVALFGVLFLPDDMNPVQLLAVAIIAAGIFATIGAGRAVEQPRAALAYAVITGCLIALYTIIDGLAVRRGEGPLTYVVWSGLAFSPVLLGFGAARHGKVMLIRSLKWWRQGIPLSIIAQGGYGLALYAFSLAPLGEVAALRETSIIFASLIGFFWLKEAFTLRKGAAILIIALGAVLLKAL